MWPHPLAPSPSEMERGRGGDLTPRAPLAKGRLRTPVATGRGKVSPSPGPEGTPEGGGEGEVVTEHRRSLHASARPHPIPLPRGEGMIFPLPVPTGGCALARGRGRGTCLRASCESAQRRHGGAAPVPPLAFLFPLSSQERGSGGEVFPTARHYNTPVNQRGPAVPGCCRELSR